jgi:hypothetical protein
MHGPLNVKVRKHFFFHSLKNTYTTLYTYDVSKATALFLRCSLEEEISSFRKVARAPLCGVYVFNMMEFF